MNVKRTRPHRAGLLLLALIAAVGCSTRPVNQPLGPIDPDRRDGPQPDPDGKPRTDAAPTEVAQCPPPPEPLKAAGAACGCDNECSTGFCQEGACCSGASCGKRGPGAACSSPDQCDSGFCADGVCCNVACTGACLSCSQSDRVGECVPVAAGAADPRQICRQDSPDSCGQSGTCNGQGGCAKFPAGTACAAGVCEGTRMVMSGAECDGDGTCVKAASIDCAPFTCEAGSCRTSCSTDANCTAPGTCVNGSCGKRGRGQDCTAADQCDSGFCVDGVCCDSACAGRCQFCASPATRGTCTPVRADAPDPRAAQGITDPARICVDQGPESCGTDGRCNGQGGCQRYRDGTTCRPGSCSGSANTETGAGTCRGGSCQVPAARSCAPFRGCSGTRCVTQCGSDGQCAAPNTCTDGSCGRRAIGAICSRDAECAAPGICAQGRCCATACTGSCRACNVEGSAGTCTPVPAGANDPAGICRDDACNNGCDGNGGCRREPAGASCRAATCSGSTLTRYTCTAAGACETVIEPCPMGQVCAMNRCTPPAKKGLGETCVAGGDCQSGSCVSGRCCAGACSGACRVCNAGSGWSCQDRPAGTACGNGGSCQGGTCVDNSCPMGETACPPLRRCVNLNNNRNHCGECNRACPLLQVCRNRTCVPRGGGGGPDPQEP